jgi:transcriptional regulator with XRE-family HTH domain
MMLATFYAGRMATRLPPKAIPQQQAELGQRLKTLRMVRKLSQVQVATRLEVGKATVSAWETGRNMPDPFALRRLAKVYEVSVDALLWDNSLSPDAMKFAAQYDNLSGKARSLFEAMWLAFFEQATSDEVVSRSLPALPQPTPLVDVATRQKP